MEDRTRDQMKMAQESSQLSSRLRAAQHKLAEAEARAERYRQAAENEAQRSNLMERNPTRVGAVPCLLPFSPCALHPPFHPVLCLPLSLLCSVSPYPTYLCSVSPLPAFLSSVSPPFAILCPPPPHPLLPVRLDVLT